MKRIIKNILVSFSIIALLISCEEELDLSNPNALSLEELLQTDDGFILLANGMLDAFQKIPANEFLFAELRSDNVRANTENGNFPAINAFNIDVNNGDVATYYSNNFSTISRANTIIDNRFLVPESQQFTVGEAFFMRALCHFNLVRAYRNVPYVDRVLDVQTEEAREFPQLPEAEVYERIVEDFRTSIAFLNGRSFDQYRPSEGAAICLAAKALLSQPAPNYAEAELLLGSVVENNDAFGFDLLFVERDDADNFTFDPDPNDPNVDLLTDAEYYANLSLLYGEVFGNEFAGSFDGTPGEAVLNGSWTNNPGLEQNEEIIFSVPYDLESSDNFTTSDSGLDDQVETDSESHSFAMTLQGPSNGVNIATVEFLEIMNPGLQPVRFPASILGFSFNPADPLNDTFNAKYPTPGEIGDNDWIILRYADVLLLYAEAILAGGEDTPDPRAVEAYNQVRRRAGLPETALLTRLDLLAERQVEFVYENQRIYDLIRFGEADNVLQEFSNNNNLFYTPQRVFLPFPQREIDNLPGFYNQNPGY